MELTILLIAVFAHLAIAIFVLTHRRKDLTAFLFSLLSIILAIWNIFNYLSFNQATSHDTLYYIRLVMFFAILHALFLYLTIYSFLLTEKISRKRIYILIFLTGIIGLLTQSQYLFSGVLGVGIHASPKPGPALPLFIVLASYFILSSIWLLLQKYQISGGLLRRQIQYLLFGIIGSSILIIISNFVLVLGFKNNSLLIYSPIYTLIFVASTAYAILAYRLFNIRLLIIETIVYLYVFALIINIPIFSTIYELIMKIVYLCAAIFISVLVIKYYRLEQQKREEIEQLDKRKSEFLADIAHKLKTPLTITRMNIDLAKKEIEENNLKKAKESAIHSMQSVDKLARLCTNLITLGKIDFGISKLHKKDLDLSKLVQDAANDFKVILGDRELKHKIEPNIKFFGDPDRLQEMILNLLDNAVKFTDENTGVIEVSLKTVENRLGLGSQYRQASFEVGLSTNTVTEQRNGHHNPNRQTIELTISDNGIGIDETVLPNLFTRYYQAESRSGSAGIGLAICKWITEGHNGKIEIESVKGKGTRMIIKFQ